MNKDLITTAALLWDLKSLYRRAYPGQEGTAGVLEAFKDILITAGLSDEKEVSSLWEAAELQPDHPLALAKKWALAGNKQTGFASERLVPMLSVLQTGKDPVPDLGYRFPIVPLSMKYGENEEVCFPRPESDLSPPKAEEFRDLWDGVVQEAKALKAPNLRTFNVSLLHILHKYTALIPGPKEVAPMVSLYDHIKTLVGLVQCLSAYQESGEQHETPLLLVAGDISGIQDFIYDIISKNAAKMLKGRSFYLQLLVESVLNRLLKGVNGDRSQVLISSGGGFYFLAPNTEATRKTLELETTKISAQLFEVHKTQLSLALNSVPISVERLSRGELPEIWDELIERTNAKKDQQFGVKVADPNFFKPGDISELLDEVTNEPIFGKNDRKDLNDEQNKGEEIWVKKSTWAQKWLAMQLRDADWWIQSPDKIIELAKCGFGKCEFNPCQLGTYHYFISKDKRNRIKDLPKEATIFRINTIHKSGGNFGEISFSDLMPGSAASKGFLFYGGNTYPERPDEKNPGKTQMATFSEMTGREDENRTEDTEVEEGKILSRLGVLRMDVDNLGQAFQTGFSKTGATFAHYACLSRQLDFFFKGWLSSLRERKADFKENSAIIYAGGDDLFVVGRWDLMIQWAQKIRNGFSQWSGNHPGLSVSGGVAIVTHKFPIARAAQLAKEAEEDAKDHRIPRAGDQPEKVKNAFTFLGLSVNWDSEFQFVKELKEDIKRHILNDNEVNRSFLQKVRAHHATFQRIKKILKLPPGHEVYGRWQWEMAWDFGRLMERVQKDQLETKKFLKRVRTDAFSNSFNSSGRSSYYHYLELLNLASRWAELELRQDESNNQSEVSQDKNYV